MSINSFPDNDKDCDVMLAYMKKKTINEVGPITYRHKKTNRRKKKRTLCLR